MKQDNIVKKIHSAQSALFERNNLEEALTFILPAIDATAKKRYSSLRPGKRVKDFLKDEQKFIFAMATMRHVEIGGDINLDGKPIWDWIYKNIRSADVHEAGLDFSEVELSHGGGIGYFELTESRFITGYREKFLFSKLAIFSLIILIQIVRENEDLQFNSFCEINGKKFKPKDFVGKQSNLIDFLFPYPSRIHLEGGVDFY